VLDDDVRAVATGRLADRRVHISGRVVHRHVGAELAGARKLFVARRGHDRPRAERLRDLERRGRDPTADAPHEDPLPGSEAGFRHEHPVGRLEDEGERGRLLERERVRLAVDVLRRYGDQLRMCSVPVLPDDLRAVGQAGVDHDRVALREIIRPGPEAGDHPCAVGTESPWLRDRGKTLADPEIEVVERGRLEPDEDLARTGDRVVDVLVAQDLGTAVLVDANRLHGPRS
jgi:hypothetical protein